MSSKIAVTSKAFSTNKELVRELGESFDLVKINDQKQIFTEETLIHYLSDVDGAIIGLEQITPKVLRACPQLKLISKYGVGLDNIDNDACREFNVKVGWTGGLNKLSVAEMTLGFMVSLSRNLYLTSNLLKNGVWEKRGGSQLSGKTVGIIGVGQIGKEVIRLLDPFKCRILVNDIIDQKSFYKEHNVQEVSKTEIFKQSDIVTIHTPLTQKNFQLINSKVLSSMKRNAILINTARGSIVNLQDLEDALNSQSIAAAALDVYPEEPFLDHPILKHPNLITTPHIGGNSLEAVVAMGKSSIKHLKDFFLNEVPHEL